MERKTVPDRVKEKLVELLNNSFAEQYEKRGLLTAPHTATDLIAHGVTVQDWISVKDSLPEPFVSVLVQMPGERPFPTVREGFISKDGIWQSAMFRREPGEVTHWQPMPQPPKGE